MPRAAHVPSALVLGSGRPLLLLGGYAMAPRVYRYTAELLSVRSQVYVPDMFDVGGVWRPDRGREALVALLDEHQIDRATVVAHSFAGGIAIELAAHHADRIADLILSDTLAARRRWRLAAEALSGVPRLYRLASANAAVGWVESWMHHPVSLLTAGWYGFRGRQDHDVQRVAATGVACVVLWATRDTLLRREDGQKFARELGARFEVVGYPDGTPTDHDWPFRDSELFVSTLQSLRPWALAETSDASAG